MNEIYTLLPIGKYAKGVLQCPHCKSSGPHYPSGSALDEQKERVRRWKCYSQKCEKYFIAESPSSNSCPDVA